MVTNTVQSRNHIQKKANFSLWSVVVNVAKHILLQQIIQPYGIVSDMVAMTFV